MAKQPKGLKITRDGKKFTASWTNVKTGKNSVDKIAYKYKINGGKWQPKKKWSTSSTTNKKKFYEANLSKALSSVSFKVKTSPKKSSAWSKPIDDQFKVELPPEVTLSVEEQTYPSAEFTWSVTWPSNENQNNSKKILTDVYWRTGVEYNAGETPGPKVSWMKDTNTNKEYWWHPRNVNNSVTSGSWTHVENPGDVAGKKFTRWIEAYSVGPGGKTKVNRASIRYALPNEPKIKENFEVNKDGVRKRLDPIAVPDKSYYYVYFKYSIARSYSTPIESIMPQYYIGAPESITEEGMYPPATGWTDTVKTLPPDNNKDIVAAAGFNTTNTVKDNQCLWVRVVSKNSDKQNQQAPSDPYLVYKGALSKPDNVDVGELSTTTLRSTVKADNKSGVNDSFIAIYRLIDEKEVCVGIIPNGKKETIVQYSKYEENPVLRLYTVAGKYEPSSDFKHSEDISLDPEKLYFYVAPSNDDYDYETVSSDAIENPSQEWLYEKNGDLYSYTNDSSVVTEKQYYKIVKPEYIIVDSSSGSPANSHWFEISGESLYSVTDLWKSSSVEATSVIKVPQNITVARSGQSGSVRVNWDWPWNNADVAELSWSKNEEAWESTQEPSRYEITKSKPASWVISDLENGTNWYIRVRIGVLGTDGTNYGPYGNANPWPLALTSNPSTPLISASKRVITVDGETTISWIYSSADGTAQESATLYEVIEENGQTVYNTLKTVGSEQYVNIKAQDDNWQWSAGEEHNLVVTVQSKAGLPSENYSNVVTISVAEPAKCKIVDPSFENGVLTKMPITFSAIEDYILTEDETVIADKKYYEATDIAEHVFTYVGEMDPDRYQPVESPVGNPSEQGWYEYYNEVYILTQDTEPVEGKTYYIKFSENPKENGWYESYGSGYILTEDTSMVSGTEYYNRSGDPIYEYNEVTPIDNPKSHGYFERKPLDIDTIVSATIKRAENFSQARPDDSEFDGFKDETIYSGTPEDGNFVINTEDLVSNAYLDDRADYILELDVQDELGQTDKDTIPFTVAWEHQAFSPEATVEIDQEATVAYLHPIAPKSSIEYIPTTDTEIDSYSTYYEPAAVINPVVEDLESYFEFTDPAYVYTKDTQIDLSKTYYTMEKVDTPVIEDIGSYYEYSTIDVCDIYRLSVDKPELIYEGATFGETYVDPYPTIGEYGGHRFVCRTPNGDYITEDNEIAWTDTLEEDGDRFDTHSNIIDFDGDRVFLLYEVDLSNSWSKDFKETRYLGGSIQGDWNPGVAKTSSMNVTTVSDLDQETIRLMHKLANYPGICHVRTKDGASYSADVQINETYEYTRAPRFNKYDLSITKVDAETLDAVTLEEWIRDNAEESE